MVHLLYVGGGLVALFAIGALQRRACGCGDVGPDGVAPHTQSGNAALDNLPSSTPEERGVARSK